MLISSAISELAVESSSLALWREFLALYFDGAGHTVGANTATAFPAAELRSQQAAVSQPLGGLAISVVCAPRVGGFGQPAVRWDWNATHKRIQICTLPARWWFFLRVRKTNTGTGNADKLIMTAGELLYGLLRNAKAVQPLEQKGILHLRPTAPELVAKGDEAPENPDNDYLMRLVCCDGQMRYPIFSQPDEA